MKKDSNGQGNCRTKAILATNGKVPHNPTQNLSIAFCNETRQNILSVLARGILISLG